MIEVMAALTIANSAFKAVQSLCAKGAEIEQVAGQLGKWYTAAADIRTAADVQKPSIFRRVLNRGSVEEEALNQIIAQNKLAEHERELRSMIVLTYGTETYRDMIQMRKDIRAARERDMYASMRFKRKIVDGIIIVIGAVFSIYLIVMFIDLISNA